MDKTREHIAILDEIRKNMEVTDSIDDLKRLYRKLVKKWHPDVNNWDTTTIMKEINQSFDNNILRLTKDFSDLKMKSHIKEAEIFKDLIEKLMKLDGLKLEICGWYLWVTGDTKKHKDKLKEAGLYFARKKVAWYYKPEWCKSNSRGQYSLDDIRSMHGSNVIKDNEKPKKKYTPIPLRP